MIVYLVSDYKTGEIRFLTDDEINSIKQSGLLLVGVNTETWELVVNDEQGSGISDNQRGN